MTVVTVVQTRHHGGAPVTGTQHRFIALLRAVNVGGYSIVKMSNLRTLFS